jgi:hypothetical protein
MRYSRAIGDNPDPNAISMGFQEYNAELLYVHDHSG